MPQEPGKAAVVLFAAFFLIIPLVVCPNAKAALLYPNPPGWPATPSVYDPQGDDGPGRDIHEGAWWAWGGGG